MAWVAPFSRIDPRVDTDLESRPTAVGLPSPAPSARSSRDGLGIRAALSIRGCRVGDRIRQRFSETAVAPVVHVQPIGREKYLERDASDVVPVPHEREAVKLVHVL